MPLTWFLRVGPVVHRESIPLSQLENFSGSELGGGYEGRSFVRVSDKEMLFSAARWFSSADDDAAIVNKGGVVIKGGKAEIVYRASPAVIAFLTLWFGLLIAGEVIIWFYPPSQPLPFVFALLAMMVVAALVVRRTIRVEVDRLRGVALEAAMRLREHL